MRFGCIALPHTRTRSYTYADGSTFEGTWLDGTRCNGMGTHHSADGCSYTGEFRNNQREGHGTH